eukprot:Stramenopile-MAST_4_protein_5279
MHECVRGRLPARPPASLGRGRLISATKNGIELSRVFKYATAATKKNVPAAVAPKTEEAGDGPKKTVESVLKRVCATYGSILCFLGAFVGHSNLQRSARLLHQHHKLTPTRQRHGAASISLQPACKDPMYNGRKPKINNELPKSPL